MKVLHWDLILSFLYAVIYDELVEQKCASARTLQKSLNWRYISSEWSAVHHTRIYHGHV